MRDLVEYLASAIVDDPTPVEVTESVSGDDALFKLKVGKDDLGKVIGKKGRTAKALRTLLAAAGAKQNLRVNLEIVEPDDGKRSPREPADGDSDDGDSESGDPNAGR